MGHGFYFCVGAAIWQLVRSCGAYSCGARVWERHYELKLEIWLAATIVIGSLK